MNKSKSDKIKKIYLGGAMEGLPNKCLLWVKQYKKIFEYLFYDVECITPYNFDIEYKELRKLKKENLKEFQKTMEGLICSNTDNILSSDCLIIKWDGEPICDICGDVQIAFIKSIPVYLITSINQEDIPSYFLGCITELFKTDIDLFEFLINTRI